MPPKKAGALFGTPAFFGELYLPGLRFARDLPGKYSRAYLW